MPLLRIDAVVKKFGSVPRGGPAVARHQGRGVLRAAGPERLRQDHAVADARRLRDAGRGPHPARRQGHRAGAAAPAPGQHDVPELRAVSASFRARQHRLRPEARGHGARGDRRPRGRDGRAGQARGTGEAQARPALRRPEAARGAGALAGAPAAAAAARRAARRARQEAAREHPARTDGTAAPARHDLRHRHPRSGRGDDGGRPHRRDGCGPARTGRDAQRELYEAPASRWVAEFVGDINIFEGQLERARSRPAADRDARRRHARRSTQPRQPVDKTSVCVAIRPEKVKLSRRGPASDERPARMRSTGWRGS